MGHRFNTVTRLQLAVTGVCGWYTDALSHLLNEVDDPLLGCPVQVQRLQAERWVHLNDMLGAVNSFDAVSGRYLVRLAQAAQLRDDEGLVSLPREALLRLESPPVGLVPDDVSPPAGGAVSLGAMAQELANRVVLAHREIDEIADELERELRSDNAQIGELRRLEALHAQAFGELDASALAAGARPTTSRAPARSRSHPASSLCPASRAIQHALADALTPRGWRAITDELRARTRTSIDGLLENINMHHNVHIKRRRRARNAGAAAEVPDGLHLWSWCQKGVKISNALT